MNPAYVYLQIYRMFDDITPIRADCGRLCKKACCKGDDAGMYLFPGEKAVYDLLRPSWVRIENSDLEYEYEGKSRRVSIAFCDGHCDRYQRPLSCRIFPLTPYVGEDGRLRIIMDPRARSVCPMSALKVSDLDPQFVKNVRRAFVLLMKNKRIAAFMREYSGVIDDYARFFG